MESELNSDLLMQHGEKMTVHQFMNDLGINYRKYDI